jgi:hypothetical protein
LRTDELGNLFDATRGWLDVKCFVNARCHAGLSRTGFVAPLVEPLELRGQKHLPRETALELAARSLRDCARLHQHYRVRLHFVLIGNCLTDVANYF